MTTNETHQESPPVGLAAHFERAARRWPTAITTVDRPPDIAPEKPTKLTFVDLYQIVLDASATLAAAGVTAGQRIVIIKRNHFDIVLLGAAANRIGAVPAMLSARIDHADIETVLQRVGASLIVTDRWTLTEGALARVDFTGQEQRLVIIDEPVRGGRAWASLRGGPVPPARPPTWHEPMLITHTSGTTGVPKLVPQSAAVAETRMKLEQVPVPVLRLKASDRALVCIQWGHALCVTETMMILDTGMPILALSDPEPTRAAELIAEFRPTIFQTLPNIYLLWEKLVDDPRRLFADVRLFVNSFDAMHPATVLRLLEASKRRLPLWLQGWGQSETGVVTASIYWAAEVRKRLARGEGLRDIGFTRPGFTKVRVLDPDTKEPVRSGQAGQLHIETTAMGLGYLGQEDLFRKRLRGKQWSMGDIGRRRWNGGLDLLDRQIDQVAGIESCINLEDVLLARYHQANEVVVTGDFNDRPHVVVCTHGDVPIDKRAWAEAVAGLPDLGEPIHLPWLKVPRTGTWKVRRPHLRAMLFGGHETATAPVKVPAATIAVSPAYDVAIAGAGLGGSILAAVLARAGLRVVLVDGGAQSPAVADEATTPRISQLLRLIAEEFHVPELAPARLFDDVLRERNGVKHNAGFVYQRPGDEPHPAEAQLHAMPGERHLFRPDVDAYLVLLAAQYGADIRQTAIEAIVLEDAAVRLRIDHGRELVARYLVDASAGGSVVDQLLGLAGETPDLATHSWSLFTQAVGVVPFDALLNHRLPGRLHEGTLHHVFDGGWLGVMPFNNHARSTNPVVSVGLQLDPRVVPPPAPADAESFFRAFVARFPALERQLAGARAVRPWRVVPRLQRRAKTASGQRWCRLPSAHGFVDPLFSTGLTQTLEGVRLLAATIRRTASTGLGDLNRERDLDAHYERWLRAHDRVTASAYAAFGDAKRGHDAWLAALAETAASPDGNGHARPRTRWLPRSRPQLDDVRNLLRAALR